MSDSFWAAKLAGREPPPATDQPSAWWSSNPLSAEVPPPAPPALPAYPAYPGYPPPAPATNARTARGERCPECGSANFMQPTRTAQFRCFDCNYPNMHSTSGAQVNSTVPHGKPVRQAYSPGFQPGNIIGRIS